jgi:hypothetical protein
MKGALFPTIPDVNPPSGNRGTTLNVTATASNSNFNMTSQLSFSGDGITVNSGAAISPTKFQANITIASDATLGFRDVTVTTTLSGGTTETTSGLGIFFVEDVLTLPTITGVLPSEAALDETLDITITAANTHFSDSSAADFGSGITVNSFTASSDTVGVANITIDNDNATLGYHSVVVATGLESAFEDVVGPLLVASKTLSEGIPRIISLDPDGAGSGASLTVTAIGENTHFEDGVSVGSFSGEGITVNATNVKSATEVELDITIAASAAHGFRDVSIATGSEVASVLDGFEVANQPPTANAGPDQTVSTSRDTANVTLDGSGSTDVDGTIAEYLWSGAPDPDDVAKPAVSLVPGTYTFTLVVKDNEGAESAPDTVTITVQQSGMQCFGGMTTPDAGVPRSVAGDGLVVGLISLVLVAAGRRTQARRANTLS